MYNKTLFTQLMDRYNQGVAPSMKISLPSAEHPYTYSEFIDVCLKLKQAYVQMNPSNPDFYPCAGYDLDSAIYSNNANYFNADASVQTITSDNFVQAIEFMQRLYTDGVIAPSGGTTGTGETAFINGRSLFFYAGPWKMKDYWQQISFEWDLAPMCVGPAEGAQSVAYVGSMGYVISSNSKLKKEAAFLAEYLATNENSQRSQYRRGQAIPNVKGLADEFVTNSRNLLLGTDPAQRGVWIDVIDGAGQTKTDVNGVEYTDIVTGKYRPAHYTYANAWRTDFSQWLDGQGTNGKSVWKNQITARDSLTAFAPILQQLLDDMKAQATL